MATSLDSRDADNPVCENVDLCVAGSHIVKRPNCADARHDFIAELENIICVTSFEKMLQFLSCHLRPLGCILYVDWAATLLVVVD